MIESNPDNTEFVLPIVCPHCSKEINLAMIFALLAPDAVVPKPIEDDRDADDSDEEASDTPPNVTGEEA